MKRLNLAILALLVGGIALNSVAKDGPYSEEAVNTYAHSGATGTSADLLCSRPCIIYGVGFTTFTAVAMPSLVTIYSTNTVTGAPSSATKLWEVAVDTYGASGLREPIAAPPKPIRAGKGAAVVTGDADTNYYIFYRYDQ